MLVARLDCDWHCTCSALADCTCRKSLHLQKVQVKRRSCWSAVRSERASWRSGYAAVCKTVHPSSILGEASKFFDSHDSIGAGTAAVHVAGDP